MLSRRQCLYCSVLRDALLADVVEKCGSEVKWRIEVWESRR
jgi:hypothetical protein